MYHWRSNLRLGLAARNLVRLWSDEPNARFTPPRYITAGIAARIRRSVIAIDNEIITGTYGGLIKKSVDFWFLRCGLEQHIHGPLYGRLGLTVPIVAKTSTLGDLRRDLPWPKLGASAGIGIKTRHVSIDVAVYGDPARSYVSQSPKLASALTLQLHF